MSWTQDYCWGKAPWGGFLSHSDWPLIEVIVTWTHQSENYPTPTCLAPQKMWHLQTKFMAHWVTHGNNHSTHILHLTLEHASVLHKKDGYQSCFSCYHLTVIICTHPSMSVQPYPSCSRTHTKNHTAITPGHQSSDAEPQQPWPQLTLTVIVPVGINITKKKKIQNFCAQYNMTL